MLDGLINLNKPVGITSAKALYRVRSITGERKSGHAGTLDPGASGVLLICMGRATKLVERIMDQPKVYRASARLDVTSNSHDADAPMSQVDTPVIPDVDTVRAALDGFEGDIEQIPPAISAVKVGGQPAYKRARWGQSFELKPRRARVYWIHLHCFDWPVIDFEMCCGRGTYVRAIIRDLGAKLHTGGCLTTLVRTRVGPFDLCDAWTLDSLETPCRSECVHEYKDLLRLLEPRPLSMPVRPGRTECTDRADY